MTGRDKDKRRFPVSLNVVVGGGVASSLTPRKAVAPATGADVATPDRGSLRATGPVTSEGAASAARARMAERLAERLAGTMAPHGKRSPTLDAVLHVMSRVPRHAFVPGALQVQAYEDTALPIGHGQTISRPSTVARLLELALQGQGAARRGHLGRVLEIGTGCGYQAALLSCLSTSVISIERVQALHSQARMHIDAVSEVRRSSMRLVLGDGRLGHPPNAPYDTIVAAASGEDVPSAWTEQLAVGGRLIAPVTRQDARVAPGNEAASIVASERHDPREQQVLVVVDRLEDGFVRSLHETVYFVPLESGIVRPQR